MHKMWNPNELITLYFLSFLLSKSEKGLLTKSDKPERILTEDFIV